MMDGMMMSGMGVWMLLVSVVVVAVLVMAVLGGAWLVRRLSTDGFGGDRPLGTGASARRFDGGEAYEVLRRRYAAGEIDEEEYERRLAGLTWR